MNNADRALDALRHADAHQPFIIAQLGQSLDGRIALPSGESKYINGPAALDHLHRLRAEVDAVVVGIGTILADDPQLNVRRVPGRNPARVIIDPNARFHEPKQCLVDDDAPVILLRRKQCRMTCPKRAEILRVDDNGSTFDCHEIINTLFVNGFRRILIEGGAATVSRFFDERQLDRLHLLIGPVFLGSGQVGLNLKTPKSLAEAVRTNAGIYPLDGGDVLIDCPLQRDQAR